MGCQIGLVLNKLSTSVTESDLPHGRCGVLVSEILGTLLLGENALQYIADARRRLLLPDAVIIPAEGRQFATLVESD